MTVYMKPKLLTCVKEQGGPEFVRQVPDRERREHTAPFSDRFV